MEKLFGNYEIEQSDEFFKLTTDSVFLSEFLHISPAERAIELGTGAGALWVLAAAKNPDCHIDGAEILPGACDLARRNMTHNNMQNRGEIKCCDISHLADYFPAESYDVCFANPPYFDRARGEKSKNICRESARAGNLDIFISAASCALKSGGRFYFCYRCENIGGVELSLQKAGFGKISAQKVIDRKLCFWLFMAQKDTAGALKILDPLQMRGEHGDYSAEYKKAYRIDI